MDSSYYESDFESEERSEPEIPILYRSRPDLYLKSLESEHFALRKQLKSLNDKLNSLIEKTSNKQKVNSDDLSELRSRVILKQLKIQEVDRNNLIEIRSKLDSEYVHSLKEKIKSLNNQLKITQKKNRELNRKTNKLKEIPDEKNEFEDFVNTRIDLMRKIETLEQSILSNFTKFESKKASSERLKCKLVDLSKIKFRSGNKKEVKKVYYTLGNENSLEALEFKEKRLERNLKAFDHLKEQLLEKICKKEQELSEMKLEVDQIKLQVKGSDLEQAANLVHIKESPSVDTVSRSVFKTYRRVKSTIFNNRMKHRSPGKMISPLKHTKQLKDIKPQVSFKIKEPKSPSSLDSVNKSFPGYPKTLQKSESHYKRNEVSTKTPEKVLYEDEESRITPNMQSLSTLNTQINEPSNNYILNIQSYHQLTMADPNPYPEEPLNPNHEERAPKTNENEEIKPLNTLNSRRRNKLKPLQNPMNSYLQQLLLPNPVQQQLGKESDSRFYN